jgi:hypothetical protein
MAKPEKLTLEEWASRYNRFIERAYCKPAMIVHDDRFDESRRELFHLSDYLVSSVCAGTIYLIPRSVESR